jgi:hypothetical protein
MSRVTPDAFLDFLSEMLLLLSQRTNQLVYECTELLGIFLGCGSEFAPIGRHGGEQKRTTIGLAGLSTRVRPPTLGGEVISPLGGHSMRWS